jgi:hypothetical protein
MMAGPLNAARFVFRAVLLPSGQVLAAGGRTADAFEAMTLSSAELYY